MPPTDKAMRWMSSEGISIEMRGSGVPVLMMHGIGGNANSCALLAERLSNNGYRTISWDAPGYGQSTDASVHDDHVDVAAALITELGSGPVHVFGTSWGGVIGTQMAARYPELVRSLVLASSTRGSCLTKESADRMLKRINELRDVGPEVFAARRFRRLVSPVTPTTVADTVRREMAAVRLPGYSAAARMMARTNNTVVLTALKVPSFVVVGRDDFVTGVEESRLVSKLIPGAGFEILEDAGHAALQEQPGLMADAVLRFWAGQA
ncbi:MULTISPECIES: alpha/beta hydrolase [Paenarthrobacter]|uniref:alpha/beta fold hydrolase n=1 Tax=Paenarthrobacter TaxID=1742992 RepID=UPI001669025B|nr:MULTISPECIES: alpha/beta hydrolase [Paenarthrobacter]MBP2395168.1 pimeloyl-ACP methyl ester carboxylesterase [Paenarthrobacter nicotinovorans]UKE98684.1 alpha/beta hydrolase [Paenarthrobacter nicotinovorans]UKF03473.1 alpha/beta hydrolase [Paenarthrobacter nicotinovorans]GGV36606.1 3-oxoadipate enol-lactonase [Paenarthrobacter nicotinovorans]